MTTSTTFRKINPDVFPEDAAKVDASEASQLRGTVQLFVSTLAILLASIALASAYLVGAGHNSFGMLFWVATSTLLVILVALVTLESRFNRNCAREQLVILLLVTVCLTSIGPLTTSYGLPGYDQSWHLGSIYAIKEHGWPFPESLDIAPGTSYVGSYPALDFLTLEANETGALSLFIAGRIVPWILSLTTFGLLAGIIYKSRSRRAYLVPYMVFLGGNYSNFYLHTWLMSESFSFCMFAAILFLILHEKPLRSFPSTIMLLVFVVALNFSHGVISFFVALLLVFLVIGGFINGAHTQRHPERSPLGERCRPKPISVVLPAIALIAFASVLIYENLTAFITQSWDLLIFLLNQSASQPTVASGSPSVEYLLWLGSNLTVILFMVALGILGLIKRGMNHTFLGWFLPGLLLSGTITAIAFVSLSAGANAIDITRVLPIVEVTLIVLLIRPYYRNYLKFVALAISVFSVSMALVMLPPSALNHDFHPTAAEPALSYTFEHSDYAGAEWLSKYAVNTYTDEPMNELIQGIWQSKSSSNQSLYLGGFDFDANKGTYAFRNANFDMVQLPAMHQGTFVQFSESLFLNYLENQNLALTYDNGNVIAFASTS